MLSQIFIMINDKLYNIVHEIKKVLKLSVFKICYWIKKSEISKPNQLIKIKGRGGGGCVQRLFNHRLSFSNPIILYLSQLTFEDHPEFVKIIILVR